MKWRRGQGEIDMRFTTLTRMAHNVMIYKYVGEECRVEARHDRDHTVRPTLSLAPRITRSRGQQRTFQSP